MSSSLSGARGEDEPNMNEGVPVTPMAVTASVCGGYTDVAVETKAFLSVDEIVLHNSDAKSDLQRQLEAVVETFQSSLTAKRLA